MKGSEDARLIASAILAAKLFEIRMNGRGERGDRDTLMNSFSLVADALGVGKEHGSQG